MNAIAVAHEVSEIEIAIRNLEMSRRAVERMADSMDNSNSEMAHILSMMALEMRMHSGDLQSFQQDWL